MHARRKGEDKMLNVLLYTTQPVLALGLTAAFEEEGDCHLASICSTTPLLLEALTRERFGVLLIEAAPEIRAEMLSDIKDAAQGTPIVIWVDAVSTEFVAQAISLGVRGVLRRNLSLELQVRCLEKVGSQKALKAGGCPFVLAEHEKNLDRLGVEAFQPPDGFWEKLDHLPVVHHALPPDVKRVLRETLPNPNLDY